MQETNPIIEYASGLPEPIKELLLSADVGHKLQSIGEKHYLHVDSLETLFAEMGQVFMGFTHPRDFSGKLAKSLGISIDTAAKITTDINNQILDPVRKDIEKVYEERGSVSKEVNVINSTLAEEDGLAHITRDNLLSEIENPIPVGFRSGLPAKIPPPSPMKSEGGVDMKIERTATPATPTQVVEQTKTPAPSASMFASPETKLIRPTTNHTEEVSVPPEGLRVASKVPPRNDPYREPVE